MPGVKIPDDYRLCRVFQRFGLRQANQLIAPSTAHAQEVAREIHRTLADISIIPHGLPPWWPLGRDPEVQNTVLYVGRLERGKGILDALRSFRLLLEACPETQLVIIGPPHRSMEPELIGHMTDELHLKENVRFLGGLPQEQVIPWYKRARVFLFPSYYESFGLVALEAMACGLPIVGYNAGAIPEVVQHGHTGLLVEPGDIEGLAEGMIQLISDDDAWKTMSLAAEQSVDKYRDSQVIPKTELVYNKLLEKLKKESGK
jgi:D-inositol-3-phosphate glycosyltransferase